MDWNLAISRNAQALLRIVAALFALAGLSDGRVASTLPRTIYFAVLRVLRPAEAAVRRLIFLTAIGLVLKCRAPRPAPVGLIRRVGAVRHPTFCLLDPLKTFSAVACDIALVNFDDDQDFIDLADNNEAQASFPRISVPGFFDPALPALAVAPVLTAALNARHVILRLQALVRALDTLPAQARRPARWRSRRDLILQTTGIVRRLSPLRPGSPPGSRQRRRHEIDHLLRECHGLALDAMDQPNTS